MASWWSAPTTHHAFVLSWISVVITLVAAGGGISIYVVRIEEYTRIIRTGPHGTIQLTFNSLVSYNLPFVHPFQINKSSLMLCFGLENLVDFLSSVVVLWRFYCPHSDPELEKRLARREKRASVAISLILGLLGFGITGAAIDDLVKGAEEEEKLKLVVAVSFFSILIFGLLTIIKFHYSYHLNSASLHKDGICSLIGTVLSTALFVNTLIIDHAPGAWWIDPLVALACGVAAIIIGLYAIVVAACIQGLPIWTCRWWSSSQGDGTDEITGRKLGPEDFPEEDINGTEMTVTSKTPADESEVV